MLYATAPWSTSPAFTRKESEMGIIILSVIVSFICVAIVIALVASDQNDWDHYWKITGVGTAVVVLIVLLSAGFGWFFDGRSKTIELEMFYNVNSVQYQAEIEMMRDSLPAGDDYVVDAVNFAQVQKYQEAVSNYRESVVDYNMKLRRYLYWQDHFWNGLFLPNISPELEYLEVNY